jgi:putative ABC transport system permease protein
VRQALGGAAGRLTRQLVTESVVLSALGGVAGLAVLLSAKNSLVRLVPPSIPRLNEITIDWPVLLFAFSVSLIAGVLFGLAPALQVRRLDLTRVLKREGRGSTASSEQARTRRWLVAGEFALSLVLMMAAALLVRSFWNLTHASLGFDPNGVTVVHTRLPYPNDPKEDLYPNAAAQTPFLREVFRRVSALPGVQEAALGTSSGIPLDHPEQDQNILRVVFEGHVNDEPSFLTGAVVMPEYFHLLGVPLLRGRLLNESDDAKSPLAAVINESAARQYWPNEDPLGKRLKLSPLAPAWTTIVGVVADARTESLESARVPVLYASIYQRSAKHLAIFLRGHVPTSIDDQVREAIQSINPALPVFGLTTLDRVVATSLGPRRFAMEMLALFALTALLLAGLGIFGVISYLVSERTHEIGVRLALGAQQADVLRMVLHQGLSIAVTGGVLGLATALGVTHALSGLLYGVRPTDPLTFGVVTVTLTAIALVACYVPARRAIAVDPIEALRY